MPSVAGSELFHFAGQVWRAVEAQHKVSTMRLVDNDLRQQALLESLIETGKPPLAAGTAGLHWLLAAPFRYSPPPGGSRFRAALDPGVFYGALQRRTACAECGYWRWRFVRDSAGLSRMDAHPMSLFDAAIQSPALDLRAPPFDARRLQWTDPVNYAATQAIGQEARRAGAGAILYESVRDPERGGCAAVLSPDAFVPGQEPLAETWYLTVTASGAVWQRDRATAFSFGWN